MHDRSRVIATLLAAASLLGALVAPLARGAAGCAGVTVAGAWRKVDAPVRAVAFTVDASGRIYVAGDRE
ncbi:MAG: hypothetical protein M3279_06115, partial [Actinomycetota bacterium]|nr:hypothetical protein [Actinomycetota bacterium]